MSYTILHKGCQVEETLLVEKDQFIVRQISREETYLWFDCESCKLLLPAALVVVARVNADFYLRVQPGINFRRRINASSRSGNFYCLTLPFSSSSIALS